MKKCCVLTDGFCVSELKTKKKRKKKEQENNLKKTIKHLIVKCTTQPNDTGACMMAVTTVARSKMCLYPLWGTANDHLDSKGLHVKGPS